MTNVYMKPPTLDNAYRVFFEAVKSDDMSAIVEAAGEFFGVPVLVTDENYRLISMYPQRTIGVEVWDTLHNTKVLPAETIKAYVDYYLPNFSTFYEPFYVDKGPAESCPRIFGEIHDGKHILGHVALFLFNRPLYPQELACVKVFIDALSMQFSARQATKLYSLSTYLLDAIQEDTYSDLRALATSRLASAIKGDYLVMVTPVGAMASSRAFASMAKGQISGICRESVSATCDNNVVTLIGGMSGDYRLKNEKMFKKIRDYVDLNTTCSGISQLFSDPFELKWRYSQAYYTACLHRGDIIFYDDAAPEPIFEMIRQNMDVSVFAHPLISRIRKYDQENNSEYLQSLKEYVMAFRDKDQAAEVLNIHKNTLVYRLNRIEDMFKVDLSDKALLRALITCFMMN